NLLLLGSDTRTGRNGAIGGRSGCACSDTIMLAHISPGHGNVTVVSIPRETIERQTGVYINDVVMLNFLGFQKVIDDIGGVNVCLPFSIDNVVTYSEGSGLHLSAGRHHINGRVALQFWRTRYNVADGSDIARIARDQYLMAQIVKGVLRSGLLRSPTKIFSVITDVANAMTTDASDIELLHIATSLRG